MQGVIVDYDEGGDDQGDGEAEDRGVVKLVDDRRPGGDEIDRDEGKFLDPDRFHHEGQNHRDDRRRQVHLQKGKNGVEETEDEEPVGPRRWLRCVFGVVDDNEAAAAEIEEEDVQSFEVAVGDQVGKPEDKGDDHDRQQGQS